jgi:hypothetical protein
MNWENLLCSERLHNQSGIDNHTDGRSPAELRKDYGKAAYFLGFIDERLPAKDPRSSAINQQIKELQLKEVR